MDFFGLHQLNALFFIHCAFVDGWAPIIQRWEDDNFSIMQALVMTVGMMMAASGSKRGEATGERLVDCELAVALL